jgi:hypothetical protein
METHVERPDPEREVAVGLRKSRNNQEGRIILFKNNQTT